MSRSTAAGHPTGRDAPAVVTDAQTIEREAREVLGAAPTEVRRLAHGTRAEVTRAVWRVDAGGPTAILKVIGPAVPEPGWRDPRDPTAIRYWERELRVYEGGFPAPYAAAGIRAPQLLLRIDRPNGDVALWLEDVQGVPGREWDLGQYEVAARRLGRAQGAYPAGTAEPSQPWLSDEFLSQYLAGWSGTDWSLLDSEEAWRQPLPSEDFPPGLREEMTRLHADRLRLLRWTAAAPRTVCHLDVWPANLFDDGERTVLIDWAFTGRGAIGEDPGNLVPDSVLDLWRPASQLRELDATVFEAYLAGLRDAGWDGDVRLVRLAMCASAIKYDWVTPAMLARASDPRHVGYGGGTMHAETLFRERGAALMFLAGWAEEARSLAAELGLDREEAGAARQRAPRRRRHAS